MSIRSSSLAIPNLISKDTNLVFYLSVYFFISLLFSSRLQVDSLFSTYELYTYVNTLFVLDYVTQGTKSNKGDKDQESIHQTKDTTWESIIT